MTNAVLGAVLIFLLLGCSHTGSDQQLDLERLLAANAKARGGAARFEKL